MRILTTLSLSAIILSASAQELSKNIPTRSNVVITFNTASIGKQLNKAEIKKTKYYEKLDETLANYFEEKDPRNAYIDEPYYGYDEEEVVVLEEYSDESYPVYRKYNLVEDIMLMSIGLNDDFGLSSSVPMHFFARNADSISYTAFMAKISDPKKLNEFIKKMADDKFQKKNKIVTKHYQYIKGNNNAVIWNKEVVVFLNYTINSWRFGGSGMYDYMYEEYPEEEVEGYYENYEERMKEQKRKQEERINKTLTAYIDEIFTGGAGISMAKNEYFQNAHKGVYDAAFFSNAFSNLYSGGGLMSAMGSGKQTDKMMSLYEGNYTYGHVNFAGGKAEIDFYNVTNAKFGPITQKMLDAKINPNFLHYLNGDKLLAMGGFAFNTDAADDMFYQLYLPLFETADRFGEALANGFDIFYTLIDKKQLFSLVKGDMVAAITDIKEFEITYDTYEYDDEFNMTTITQTKKEIMPEYVIMLSSDNPTLLNKFLKLYESMEMLVKKDHYYQYVRPSYYGYNTSSETEFYIAHHNGILFFTNNFSLIEDLGKGDVKYPAVSSNISKLSSKNYFGYWDMSKTTNKYNNLAGENPDHAIPNSMKPFAEKFKSVTMQGIEYKGNTFSNKIVVELTDSKENSLKNVLNALIELNK